MASEKALYWMAVGLVALMAGNHFASRFDGRGLAERSMAWVEQLSGQSGSAFAVAESWASSGSSRCVRAQAAMARAQAHVASVQTAMARQDAACARLQAERARLMTMQQTRVRVIVPNQNFRVEIPEITVPAVQMNSGDDDSI